MKTKRTKAYCCIVGNAMLLLMHICIVESWAMEMMIAPYAEASLDNVAAGVEADARLNFNRHIVLYLKGEAGRRNKASETLNAGSDCEFGPCFFSDVWIEKTRHSKNYFNIIFGVRYEFPLKIR